MIGLSNKIEIMKMVVKDIVDNSIDLKPEIVDLVDKEFWNLI